MTAFIPSGEITIAPDTRGGIKGHGLITIGVCRWPTDPIGTTTVTFSGVKSGSEIRVYDNAANELAGVESCIANQALTWQVYAPGSPLNIVRIVIVSTGYELLDFTYESSVGDKSIPIFQQADRWYRNP